jgi:hypothetical protein
MHLNLLGLPWILLFVAACAHGLVVSRLAAHRKDGQPGVPYFFFWQTWDCRNYTDDGKRLYKWLPITAIVFVIAGVLTIAR